MNRLTITILIRFALIIIDWGVRPLNIVLYIYNKKQKTWLYKQVAIDRKIGVYFSGEYMFVGRKFLGPFLVSTGLLVLF
jgi:hypothetical protein